MDLYKIKHELYLKYDLVNTPTTEGVFLWSDITKDLINDGVPEEEAGRIAINRAMPDDPKTYCKKSMIQSVNCLLSQVNKFDKKIVILEEVAHELFLKYSLEKRPTIEETLEWKRLLETYILEGLSLEESSSRAISVILPNDKQNHIKNSMPQSINALLLSIKKQEKGGK